MIYICVRKTTDWDDRATFLSQLSEDFRPKVEVWDATNRQDIGLVEAAWRGVLSRRYVPGPLSLDREPAIRSALRTYLALMGD